MSAGAHSESKGATRWFAGALTAMIAVVGLVAVPSGTASSEAFPGLNGKIAFVKPVPDTKNGNIWTMDPDGSNQTKVTDADAYDSGPQWSPDGTKIVFQREPAEGPAQVWVIGADGSGETQLTTSTVGAGSATWSPDGTKLVYVDWPEPNPGKGPALFVMNADGSGQTQLTLDNNWDRWPSWSPDGTHIAFGRSDTATATQIWVIDADGTNPVQLTTSSSYTLQSFGPSWSPDGSQLTNIYRTDGPVYFTYVMNADGSDPHQIAGPGTGIGRWSPDGQLIAFSSTDASNPGIWTMAPDGSGSAPLLVGQVWEPAWQRLPAPVSPTTTAPATTSTSANAAATVVTPRFTG